MFWNKYPYTDFHELNLDAILRMMKELNQEWDEFKALNTITVGGEWNITHQYTPWTIVTDDNGLTAYISLQPVPAGIDISNTDYWLRVMDYEPLIEELDERITELERLTAAMKNRNFIVIGDSFSYGSIDSQTLGVGWAPKFQEMYEGYELGKVYWNTNMLVPGVSGFASTRTFLSMLQEIPQIYDFDPDSITDIVVLGGTNDQSYTAAQIEAGISAFCAYAHSTYPRARVAIGIVGTGVIENQTISEAYSACRKYGAEYIKDTRNLMCDVQYNSDGTHITQAGYDFYSPFIFDAIMFGHCHYIFTIDCPVENDPVDLHFVFTITEDGYDILPLATYDGGDIYRNGLLVSDNAVDGLLPIANLPHTSIKYQRIINGTTYGYVLNQFYIYGAVNGYVDNGGIWIHYSHLTPDSRTYSTYRTFLDHSYMPTMY